MKNNRYNLLNGILIILFNWVGSEGCRHPSEGVTAEKCDEKEQFAVSEGQSPYEKLRGAKRRVNLVNVFFPVVFIAIFIISLPILAEDKGLSWYAVVKINGKKDKLYTKGDIFYSDANITDCLRVIDIKKDVIILKDTDSKEMIIVEAGEKIPIEGIDIVFKKTVRTDIIKHE